MERIDVLPKQGIQFNQHAYPGGKKNILSLKIKKKGKISIFLFVEKGFYERIIGEIIAVVVKPHLLASGILKHIACWY
jgi:hypothetical protein